MVLPGRGCGLRSPLGRFYLFPESVEEKGLQGQSHNLCIVRRKHRRIHNIALVCDPLAVPVGSADIPLRQVQSFPISMLFPQGQLTNGAGLIQGGRENGP